MSNEALKPQSDLGRMKRRVRLSLPLAILFLCLGYAIYDLVEAGDKFKEEFVKQRRNVDTSTRIGRMNVMIKDQVGSLQGVDTGGLAGSFGYFLETYNCPFFIRCEPVESSSYYTSTADSLKHFTDFPPERSTLGSIWHLISASPRAVLYTCGQIAKAGNWAIAMFLSCAILWFALLIHAGRGSTPNAALLMFIWAPAGIGLMVMFAQSLCVGAMNTLGLAGCAFAVLVMAVIHGTALIVVVGSYHLSKGPREVAEEIAKIREI